MSQYTDYTDESLVRKAQDGDQRAFGELVRRYEDVLFRHATRMLGEESSATEVVQRAFVRAYRKLELCDRPTKVGGWLFRVTSNLCKDYLKARRGNHVALQDAPPLVSPEPDPRECADRAALRRELDEALETLAPEKREAFLLKHLEGRTYEEMSELLGVGISALKMRVHRAREELQKTLEHLQPEVVTAGGGAAPGGASKRGEVAAA